MALESGVGEAGPVARQAETAAVAHVKLGQWPPKARQIGKVGRGCDVDRPPGPDGWRRRRPEPSAAEEERSEEMGNRRKEKKVESDLV